MCALEISSNSRNCRGVSLLLEIVIGLGIFAGTVLVALGVISLSNRAAVGARQHTSALNLARAALDSELSKAFDAIVSSTTESELVNENDGVQSSTTFTVNVIVTPEGTERKQVRAEVSWRETNQVRKVRLEGYATSG